MWRNKRFCSMPCYNNNKSGNNNPNWKGGKILVDGYYYIYKPEHPNSTKDGYVAEHRLVMEESVGRFLKKEEVVHHVNRDPLDNSPENLMVCSSTGTHFVSHHLEDRDPQGRFQNTK